MTGELFEKKDAVAIAKKRFNQQKIGVMLCQQLTRGLLISCQPAQCVRQVADNRGGPFPRDRAIVGDYDARSSRRDSIANPPHKLWRLTKNRSADKRNY